MSDSPGFRLLNAFEYAFREGPYLHRASQVGNAIASQLYEDLYDLDKSPKFRERSDKKICVINVSGGLTGISARRADGTFGERNPSAEPQVVPGHNIARGRLATIEVGAEVKILMKSMIKQIDRVIGDMRKQVDEFGQGGGKPVSLGIVGINFADRTTTYEGERSFTTDGKAHKHPIQEAAKARARLEQFARPAFDEFLVLEFKAVNVEPFPFEWVNRKNTIEEYAAILTRISRKYESRF